MHIIDVYTDDLVYNRKELINNELTEAHAFDDIVYSHTYIFGYIVEEETDKIKEENDCE